MLDTELITFKAARILVVDDIASNRQLIREYLRRSGLDVIEAEDGKHALLMAEKERPGLIFMDIRMAGMGGYEATRLLKENPATRTIPVIALTASKTLEEKACIEEFGFDSCLFKPLARQELFNTLISFLPYDIKDKSQTDYSSSENQQRESAEVERVPELIRRVSEEMLPIWNELEGAMEMDLVEDFSRQLAAIALDHKANDLNKYAEKLLDSVTSFNIGTIQDMLRKFPEMIDKLKRGRDDLF